jgi:hypothetical protein
MSSKRSKSKKSQTQLNNDTPRRNQLQTKSEVNLSKMLTLTPTSTIDEKTSTHIAAKLQPGTENLETNNILDPSDVRSELIIFMKQMTISMQEMSMQVKHLNGIVSAYQIENRKMQEKLCNITDELENIKAENRDLQTKIEKIYQNEAKLMITVHGVPNEMDSKSIVKKLGDLLKVDVRENQIVDIYRINTKKKQPTSPIVIKFSSQTPRDLFIKRRKIRSLFTTDLGMDGAKNQVFVNEYLTKKTIELLYKARDLKKNYDYEFVWAKNGIVYAREHKNTESIKIENDKTLYQIIENLNIHIN